MRREVTLSTLRFVFQGGIWGSRGEYTASTSARSLRDRQVKLSGLDRAHPVVRKITRHLGVLPTSFSSSSAFTATSSSSAAAASSSSPSSTTWTGVGSWEVTSLGKPFSVSSEADSDTAVLFGRLRNAHNSYYKNLRTGLMFDRHPEFPVDEVQVQSVTGLECRTGRRFRVIPGDDVCVQYDHRPEYCTVECVYVVWIGARAYVWMMPRWYFVRGWRSRSRGIPKRHAVRQTILVERDNVDPLERRPGLVPAGTIQIQVGIVHSCNVAGQDLCRVREVCKAHLRQACNQRGCGKGGNGVEVWWHNFVRNHVYEVLDRDAGFVARYTYKT